MELIKLEHDAITNEIIERPLNQEELDAHNELVAMNEAEMVAIENEYAAKVSAKLKLEALGLTPEEIAALTK
jgi:hypothetical protein